MCDILLSPRISSVHVVQDRPSSSHCNMYVGNTKCPKFMEIILSSALIHHTATVAVSVVYDSDASNDGWYSLCSSIRSAIVYSSFVAVASMKM